MERPAHNPVTNPTCNKVTLFLAGCVLTTVVIACSTGQKAVVTDSNEVQSRIAVKRVTTEDRNKYDEIKRLILAKEYLVAEAELERFTTEYPNNAGAWANLGLVYSETNRLEKAEQALEKTIALNGKTAPLYSRLAMVYKKRGKIDDSLEMYRKALEIAPDHENTHYNIAILYDIYLQDIAKAIEHLESYIELGGQGDKGAKIWFKQLKRAQKRANM